MRYTRSVLEGVDDNGQPFTLEQDETDINAMIPTPWARAMVDRYVKRLLAVRETVARN
ncbi:MAG: hypothetical protein AAB262_11875 [Elusimicrobiota bacterium]